MIVNWYCCTECNVVDCYTTFEDGTTDFPRGEFMVHGLKNDYITTGFKTKQEAENHLEKLLTLKWVDEEYTSYASDGFFKWVAEVRSADDNIWCYTVYPLEGLEKECVDLPAYKLTGRQIGYFSSRKDAITGANHAFVYLV